MYLQQRADSTFATLVPTRLLIFLVGNARNPLVRFWVIVVLAVIGLRLLISSAHEVIALILGAVVVLFLLVPGMTFGLLTPGNRLIARGILRDLCKEHAIRLSYWLDLFPNACSTCGSRELDIYDVVNEEYGWLYSVWVCPAGHEHRRNPGMNLPPGYLTGSRHLQSHVTIPPPLWLSPKQARAVADVSTPALKERGRAAWVAEFVGVPMLTMTINFLFHITMLFLTVGILGGWD